MDFGWFIFILPNSEFLHLISILFSFYQTQNSCNKEIGNRTFARRLRIFDQRSKGISGKKEKQCQSMFINPCFINPCFINPWFINPWFINPCYINPRFINPWFINPCFINPYFINPWWRPRWRPCLMTSQVSSRATTHKIYLILLRRSKLSTKVKIVWKYCNLSKTQGFYQPNLVQRRGKDFASSSEG